MINASLGLDINRVKLFKHTFADGAKIVSSDSLVNACPLALQPNEQNTSTCLLYFSVGILMRLRDASQLSVAFCVAQVIWLSVGSPWRAVKASYVIRVKPPVTVCGCRPMQMCCFHRVFWQVRFSLARGLGETAVRYTGPTGGRGCKRVPRAEWYSRNTWRCSHTEGLSGGIWWKTFNFGFGEVKSDSQQRSFWEVQHRIEELEQNTHLIVFVLFLF